MANSKPWEALGVSRSKYYRDQRSGEKPSAKKRGRPPKDKKLRIYKSGPSASYTKTLKPMPAAKVKNMLRKQPHDVPVTADGAAAAAEGAPRHLWQAIDATSVSHEILIDEALIQEFLAITSPEMLAVANVFRVSPRMVEALRRAVSQG